MYHPNLQSENSPLTPLLPFEESAFNFSPNNVNNCLFNISSTTPKFLQPPTSHLRRRTCTPIQIIPSQSSLFLSPSINQCNSPSSPSFSPIELFYQVPANTPEQNTNRNTNTNNTAANILNETTNNITELVADLTSMKLSPQNQFFNQLDDQSSSFSFNSTKHQHSHYANNSFQEINNVKINNGENPTNNTMNNHQQMMAIKNSTMSPQLNSNMTVKSILCGIGLPHLIGTFHSEEIDLSVFVTMSDNDLESIGIKNKSERNLLLQTIESI